MKVFKYPLDVSRGDTATASLPVGAKLLHVDEQRRAFYLWALIDDLGDVYEHRTIRVAGTGNEIDWPVEKLQYINTFLMEGGRFVFHAFEVLT